MCLKVMNADDKDLQCSLDTLLRMMKLHYGKEVILLVDEYDIPLVKASDNEYYEDMLEVIRRGDTVRKEIQDSGKGKNA